MKNWFNSDGSCFHPKVEKCHWYGGMALIGDGTITHYLALEMMDGDTHKFADVEGIQNAITEANKILNERYS